MLFGNGTSCQKIRDLIESVTYIEIYLDYGIELWYYLEHHFCRENGRNTQDSSHTFLNGNIDLLTLFLFLGCTRDWSGSWITSRSGDFCYRQSYGHIFEEPQTVLKNSIHSGIQWQWQRKWFLCVWRDPLANPVQDLINVYNKCMYLNNSIQ